MLPPWMIEALEKEKVAREKAERRPELRIEMPVYEPVKRKAPVPEPRGVFRIEFSEVAS